MPQLTEAQKALVVIKNLIEMLDLKEGESLSESTPLVLKKVDVEERRILGVVLEPGTFDLHKDIYDEAEVALACKSFNEQCMQTNIQHIANVNNGDLVIEKSFIQPVGCRIGDQEVKAGSWLQQWKIKSDTVWEMVKGGDFTGFSVGCHATYEDIVDE